ncbi:MAG: tryptophan synthase subunit alpha [Gammaproteobacteria bacterium]|nr:tryptophan synthase subunit alpha [Gammaproteobacteria bacterium]
MSRIDQMFEALQNEGRKALIPYVTAGDPEPSVTVPLMHAMVEAGANLLELGVPFSDPMADGPVIQAACERALEHHVSLDDVLGMVSEFRKTDASTPVILMGYLNPVEIMGYQSFAEKASEAGVDGVLIVDLPPEEGSGVVETLKQSGLDVVFLLAPTTVENRIQKICEAGSGFVYYVSLKGVTGSTQLNVEEVAEKLDLVRKYAKTPVGVGFGIKDAETAARVSQVADAVVVGSAIVNRIAANVTEPERFTHEIAELVASMRKAMDDTARS